MAERGHALKQDINKLAWEETDFPILCNVCLGENPYIRMLKDRFGKECKICTRPFTTFKWKPGHNSRPKFTEICQTCGKIKNICQACFKDLEFRMGMCTRDKFLGDQKIEIPEHSANRDYWAEQANRHIDRLILPYENPLPALDQIMQEPRLVDVNKILNEGKIEKANQVKFDDEIDMYQPAFKPKGLLPPDDLRICTLYISHLTPELKESDVRNFFQKFGQIDSIKMMEHGQSCFVNFSKRKFAETAINAVYGNFSIKDVELRIQWARSSNKKIAVQTIINSLEPNYKQAKAPAPLKPPQNKDIDTQNKLLLEVLTSKTQYPSQDPYLKGGLQQ